MPMVTRTRRTRASRIDMQIDSDVDMDEPEPEPEEEETANVDIEGGAEGEGDEEDNGLEDEDEDEEGEEEDEEEDQIESDGGGPSSRPTPSSSRFRIKLKMPVQSRESPTIESEDSSSDSNPSTSTRPMTTRQAVLASVLDSTHVSLSGSRQKKAPLNESELALRREETARKRKNLSEKKLEDEKAETINRLLKKQSRPRNKRNTAQRDMDDVPPPSSIAGTRSNSNSTYTPTGRKRGSKKANAAGNEEQDDGDDEGGMEGVEEGDPQPEQEVRIPTMYRWISSSRAQDGTEPRMGITLSVPVSVLSQNKPMPLQQKDNNNSTVPRPKTCAAPDCGKPVRYRLVKDWTQGACGMHCLKILEASAI